MTEIKVAIASTLAAALFLVSTVAAGRAYRHASDLVIRPVEAGAPAPPPAPARVQRPRFTAPKPRSGSAPAPARTSPAPAPVQRAGPSAPPPVIVVPSARGSEIRVGRVVYFGSTDDYEDDDDPDDEGEEDGDDGK